MEAIQAEKFGNKVVKIFYDECPESPREWDNLGIIVASHRRHNLQDKEAPKIDFGYFNSWSEVEKHLVKEHEAKVIIPLYMYEHSGIALSTSPFSCKWDSRQLGFVYVTKDKILEEYGCKVVSKKVREKVISVLEGKIETYSQYLNGEVYGFETYEVDEEGEETFLGSCWGFYSIQDAIEAGKEE